MMIYDFRPESLRSERPLTELSIGIMLAQTDLETFGEEESIEALIAIGIRPCEVTTNFSWVQARIEAHNARLAGVGAQA